MKSSLIPTIILLTAIFVAGCSSEPENTPTPTEEMVTPQENSQDVPAVPQETSEVNGLQGSVRYNEECGKWYILTPLAAVDENHMIAYYPNNLPEKCQQQQLLVEFSGEILEEAAPLTKTYQSYTIKLTEIKNFFF